MIHFESGETKGPGVTFIQRNPVTCPICDSKIYREELLSGRGRLIAGDLTIELRRLYEPSQKYGSVYPLIYPVTVCPDCYYASWKDHFLAVPDKSKAILNEERENRIASCNKIFTSLNFNNSRGLEEGLASYWLAIHCYDHFHKDQAPTIHQGISALRAAWLCNDFEQVEPNSNWAYLGRTFYRKARFFYRLALEYEQKGLQSIGNLPSLGPDLDKNYGYDGLVYLNGYLEYHFGPRKNPELRTQNLQKAKRMVARIFGMGKASKNKPMVLLDNAREVYNMISVAFGLKDQNPEEDALAEDD